MDLMTILLAGLFSPAILFFAFGVVSVLVKSDIHIPPAMSTAMIIFLLASIGLGGGGKAIEAILIKPEMIGVIVVVAILAIICGVFFAYTTAHILKKFAGLTTADAWATAGHYGAVSAATLAVGVGIASAAQEGTPGMLIFGGWMAAMYPFMDSPAILTAILCGRMALAREGSHEARPDTKALLHEGLFGTAVWLLICALFIGMLAKIFSSVEMGKTMNFFDGMFRGVLALFLIDMGIAAGTRLSALKELGRNLWKAVLVGFALPQVWGTVGIFGIYLVHLVVPDLMGWGDAFVFASMAGGCSFISAPAAMRAAIPEANPSIYLPMAVALTFPFNILIGMPLWRMLSMYLWGTL